MKVSKVSRVFFEHSSIIQELPETCSSPFPFQKEYYIFTCYVVEHNDFNFHFVSNIKGTYLTVKVRLPLTLPSRLEIPRMHVVSTQFGNAFLLKTNIK